MGKAKHPHDSSRPESPAVKRALKIYEETANIEELYNALTVRQRRFAEEYVLDFNGTAAAIRAGYSPNHVDKQSYTLRNHKGVAAYIDYLTRTKEAKIMSISPDLLVQKTMEIINKEGAKDSDKLRGVEMLMRHLGMFVDKTEITGKDGGAIEVEQRRIEEEAHNFTVMMKQLRERAKKDVKVIE